MQATATTTTYQNGTTSQNVTDCAVFIDDNTQERDVINLYPSAPNQTIFGFGGAITEAVGHTLSLLPLAQQLEVLDACFGQDGLRYTVARTSIDSCDFSLSPYEAASSLNTPLDLSRDRRNIIPFLLMAQERCLEPMEIMLTPWSPPAYMKDTGMRSFGGKLKRECYAHWADYICDYILAYRAYGLNVTKLSIQNEPNAVQIWDSCLFSAEDEKQFLRDHLVLAFKKNGLRDIAVYIWDHNKERLFDRVSEVADEQTLPMIQGVAFHWYSGDHFDALRLVRRFYPELELLFSEGCIEYTRFSSENQLQNARMYAHDMIGNFNAGMNTFLDWNIALDEHGGPNHANNFCEAPILCNTKAGTYEKQLSYYYIWHFSHFVERGGRHISSTRSSEEVDAAAFQNPDGVIIAVLYNNTSTFRNVFIRVIGRIIQVDLEADSICTVRISCCCKTY
jgi:glucosylceramidase